MGTDRRRAARMLLLVLVAAHLVFLIVRIPHSVVARRLRNVSQWRELGALRYQLRGVDGASAVEWLLANTTPDTVVLWRGPNKGAIEKVPHLVLPRLLAWESDIPAAATHYDGRPLAQGALPGKSKGVLVLVFDGQRLALEPR